MKQTKLSLQKYILLNFSLADRASNWEERNRGSLEDQIRSGETEVQQFVITQII